MSSLQDVAKYAMKKGFSESSRIINVTHFDFDGIVSTINLLNFVEDPKNLFYVQKTYDNVNDFFTKILFQGRCRFKDFDWVVVTDISLNDEVITECEKRGINVLVLDHHETAYGLNKYENCCVDETETICGAEVTLNFIKEIGFEKTHLDKFNQVATQFDLFKFKTPELRKYIIAGKKRSLAEMSNIIYFKTYNKDQYIKRWIDGWGKGFNKEEVELIKSEYEEAEQHIELIENSKLKVDLDEDCVLILSNKFVVRVGEFYLDEQGKQLLLMFNPKRNKISGRVNDNSDINIGKILDTLRNKFDYVTNGGGHKKAGGCNITSNKYLDDFVENVMKLVNYYKKKNLHK